MPDYSALYSFLIYYTRQKKRLSVKKLCVHTNWGMKHRRMRQYAENVTHRQSLPNLGTQALEHIRPLCINYWP